MPKNPNIIYTQENLYYKNKVKSFNIYTIVLCAIVLSLILLPIIKVDISTQSRGIVRSTSENVPIYSMISGKITFINLRNNQNVLKGDTIIILETTFLEAESKMNKGLKNDLTSILNDLNKISSGQTSGFQTSEIQKEYQAYIQRRLEASANLRLAEKSYKRHKLLYDQGVISSSEIEKYENELESTRTILYALEKQQQASWQTHKREVIQQIKNYDGTLEQISARENNYYITAPLSGSIMNFTGIQKGTFLNTSQIIGEISTQDSLLVEIYVSPKDIGLIRKGQIVNFQIDAFNYNQWGMINGLVSDIDQNITLQENSNPFFKAWCKLDKKYLTLKNGYKGDIKKGMTLTSRVIVNRRSLWNLLYDKIDNWLNPKIITTNETE